MRRLIALVVMLVVPLQFAWAAVVGVEGHVGNPIAGAGFHLHGHDDGHADHPGHAPHAHGPAADAEHANAGDDGHHGHTHPVFSSLLGDFGLALAEAVPGGLIVPPLSGFLSRTPPLLDRPPLARA